MSSPSASLLQEVLVCARRSFRTGVPKTFVSRRRLLASLPQKESSNCAGMTQSAPVASRAGGDGGALLPGYTLFVHGVCPYAHRAWLAVHELGLTDAVAVAHPGLGPTMQAWYKQHVNPKETVPALLTHRDAAVKAKPLTELRAGADGDVTVESLDIVHHLCHVAERRQQRGHATASSSDLLPRTPEEKAAVMRFLTHVDDVLIPAMYGVLMCPPAKRADKIAKCDAALATAEAMIEAQHGGTDDAARPFLLGGRYTVADVALVPFLDRFAATLPVYADGYDVTRRAPRLARMLVAAAQRPSFRHTAMPASYYVKRYKHYTYEFAQGQDPRSRL